jgi:hypothetical protein
VSESIDLGYEARIIELERQVERLKAESRHQYELAQSRARWIFKLQTELANERDLENGARRLIPGYQAEIVRLRTELEHLRDGGRTTARRLVVALNENDNLRARLARTRAAAQ